MVYSSIGIDVFDRKTVYLLRISLRTNVAVDILFATDAALVRVAGATFISSVEVVFSEFIQLLSAKFQI